MQILGHQNSHLSAGCGLLHSVHCRRDGRPCTKGRTALRLGQVQLFILCMYYQEGLAREQRPWASSLLLWSGSVPLSLSPSGIDSLGSHAWTSSLEGLTFLTTAAEAEGSRNTCCLKMVTYWLLLYEALLQRQWTEKEEASGKGVATVII